MARFAVVLLLTILAVGLCEARPGAMKKRRHPREIGGPYPSLYSSGASRFECTDDAIHCENQYGDCVPEYWRCDFIVDCNDGQDEQDCPEPSFEWSSPDFSYSSFKLPSFGPYPSMYSDNSMFECTDDAIHCENPYGDCVPDYWRCDFIVDCNDGQDEEDCPEPSFDWSSPDYSFIIDKKKRMRARTQYLPSFGPFPSLYSSGASMFECTDDAIHCENQYGDCVPEYWRCDFIVDCDDGQDEQNCDFSYSSFDWSSPDFSFIIDKRKGMRARSGLAKRRRH